jgi:glycosyltransferase involved in cell wall biosynthesis
MEKKNKFPITVLMSTYNDGIFLENAIRSVIEQSFKNFEFLIINDGSTDNTDQILKKYKKIDQRINVYNNTKNIGLTRSLNLGLKLSIGRYIARMDGDDISSVFRLEKQYSYFKNNPNCRILATEGALVNEKGKKIKNIKIPIFKESQLNYLMNYGCPFIHSSIMFDKYFIKKFSGYNEEFRTRQDLELWLRVLSAGYKIECLKERLIYLRFNQNSTSNNSLNLYTNVLIRAIQHANEQNYNIDKKQIMKAIEINSRFHKYKNKTQIKKKIKRNIGLLGSRETITATSFLLKSFFKYPTFFKQIQLFPIVEEVIEEALKKVTK